jgi:hypothetical protein
MVGRSSPPNSISRNEWKFREELALHFENLIDNCNCKLFSGLLNMSYQAMKDIQRQFQIHIYYYTEIDEHNVLSTS